MGKINHNAETLDKALGLTAKDKKEMGKSFTRIMNDFTGKHQKASMLIEALLTSGHSPVQIIFLAYNAGKYIGEKNSRVNIMGQMLSDIERMVGGCSCKPVKKAKGKK